MGRKSRTKGSCAERELAGIFSAAGFPMKRNLVDAEGQPDGDLTNDIGLYIESRRREQWSIPAWLREVALKKKDKIGVLAFRKNHMDWHVALSLTDFLSLLKEART